MEHRNIYNKMNIIDHQFINNQITLTQTQIIINQKYKILISKLNIFIYKEIKYNQTLIELFSLILL